MSLENESTLTRDEVTSRIDALNEDQEYEVYRVKNDEVLDTFDDEDEAREYIDDEDYDPDKVMVRGGLDDDDRDELEALQSFDREALSDVPEWRDGSTVYSADYIDESYAKERAVELAPRGVDFDEYPFNLIDWSEAADQLMSDAGGNYAVLSGTRFYYL